LRISSDVIALHVSALEGPNSDDHRNQLRVEWEEFVRLPARRAGLHPPQLRLIRSEFRSIAAPLLRAIEAADHEQPDRPVVVILPELVEGRWWGYIMHTHRERRLRARLLRYGGRNVIVTTVPWQLQPPDPEAAIAE